MDVMDGVRLRSELQAARKWLSEGQAATAAEMMEVIIGEIAGLIEDAGPDLRVDPR